MPTEKTLRNAHPYILIVDDEIHCVDILQSMLEKTYGDEISEIASCNTVEEAKKSIREKEPDLVFLDVEMPGQTGFDLLKSYEYINFDVIFTTAHEHYAIKAFQFNALDYLLKPFSILDLEKSMERFWENQKKTKPSNSQVMEMFLANIKQQAYTQKKIALPTSEGLRFVAVKDIVRCDAKSNYSMVYFTDGTHQLISKTLKEFGYLLEDMNFLRIHYSHLINLHYVTSYTRGQGGYVTMRDGTMIEVSKRKKALFLERASKLL